MSVPCRVNALTFTSQISGHYNSTPVNQRDRVSQTFKLAFLKWFFSIVLYLRNFKLILGISNPGNECRAEGNKNYKENKSGLSKWNLSQKILL